MAGVSIRRRSKARPLKVLADMAIQDGEAVTGYAKGNDWISYSCLGPVTSDPVWRPVPFTVWYEHDKSCWYTYDYLRQSDCKINVIAWTHLPHPKSAEEFQDFCNSL